MGISISRKGRICNRKKENKIIQSYSFEFAVFFSGFKSQFTVLKTPPALKPCQIQSWLLIYLSIVLGARELLEEVQMLEAAKSVCSKHAKVLAQAR